MATSILNQTPGSITIQITIPLSSSSMLESEKTIQTCLNEAGTLVTGAALQQFDTNGTAITVSGESWSSKGKQPKSYQTPYGPVSVLRHVYQSCRGGETYCPLEVGGRIILTSTPQFAKQISHKYAEMSSPRLVKDLEENHGRKVHRSFVQTLCEAVGSIALSKEEDWHYQTPKLSTPITMASIGIDGTCLLLCEGGFRQAMVGTISLYDHCGVRQHTTYIAASPEYGRATFLARMSREVEHVKALYPDIHYQGLADGAVENWTFLTAITDTQVLDFYHATQYLDRVSKASLPGDLVGQKAWMTNQCHRLKHDIGAAAMLLEEMKTISLKGLSSSLQDGLQEAITYFSNHAHQMDYGETLSRHHPIGSGVTEAACKVIIKARLCAAGMKWRESGVAIVLSLRTLSYSDGRWQQFWAKINQYGFSLP